MDLKISKFVLLEISIDRANRQILIVSFVVISCNAAAVNLVAAGSKLQNKESENNLNKKLFFFSSSSGILIYSKN